MIECQNSLLVRAFLRHKPYSCWKIQASSQLTQSPEIDGDTNEWGKVEVELTASQKLYPYSNKREMRSALSRVPMPNRSLSL